MQSAGAQGLNGGQGGKGGGQSVGALGNEKKENQEAPHDPYEEQEWWNEYGTYVYAWETSRPGASSNGLPLVCYYLSDEESDPDDDLSRAHTCESSRTAM